MQLLMRGGPASALPVRFTTSRRCPLVWLCPQVTAADELAQGVDAVQQAVANIERFGKSEWALRKPAGTLLYWHKRHGGSTRHRRRRSMCRHCCPPRATLAAALSRVHAPSLLSCRREADCLQALHLGCQRAGADQRCVGVAGGCSHAAVLWFKRKCGSQRDGGSSCAGTEQCRDTAAGGLRLNRHVCAPPCMSSPALHTHFHSVCSFCICSLPICLRAGDR